MHKTGNQAYTKPQHTASSALLLKFSDQSLLLGHTSGNFLRVTRLFELTNNTNKSDLPIVDCQIIVNTQLGFVFGSLSVLCPVLVSNIHGGLYCK